MRTPTPWEIRKVNGNTDYFGEDLTVGAEVELWNGTHAVITQIEDDWNFNTDGTVRYYARIELRTLKGNLITVIE
jgi:hypothetical protein